MFVYVWITLLIFVIMHLGVVSDDYENLYEEIIDKEVLEN